MIIDQDMLKAEDISLIEETPAPPFTSSTNKGPETSFSIAQVVINPSKTWVPKDVNTEPLEPEDNSGGSESVPTGARHSSFPMVNERDAEQAMTIASKLDNSVGITLSGLSKRAKQNLGNSHVRTSHTISTESVDDHQKTVPVANHSQNQNWKITERFHVVVDLPNKNSAERAGRDTSRSSPHTRGKNDTLECRNSRVASQTQDSTTKSGDVASRGDEYQDEDTFNTGRSLPSSSTKGEKHFMREDMSDNEAPQPREETLNFGRSWKSKKRSASQVSDETYQDKVRREVMDEDVRTASHERANSRPCNKSGTRNFHEYLSFKASSQLRDNAGKFLSSNRKRKPAKEVQVAQTIKGVVDTKRHDISPSSKPSNQSETWDLQEHPPVSASSQPSDGGEKCQNSNERPKSNDKGKEIPCTALSKSSPDLEALDDDEGQESEENLEIDLAIENASQEPREPPLSPKLLKSTSESKICPEKTDSNSKSISSNNVWGGEEVSDSQPANPRSRQKRRVRNSVATYNVKKLFDAALAPLDIHEKIVDDEPHHQITFEHTLNDHPKLSFDIVIDPFLSSKDPAGHEVNHKLHLSSSPPTPPSNMISRIHLSKKAELAQQHDSNQALSDSEQLYTPNLLETAPHHSFATHVDYQNVVSSQQEIARDIGSTSIFKRAFDTLLGQSLWSRKTQPTTEAVGLLPAISPLNSTPKSKPEANEIKSAEDDSVEVKDVEVKDAPRRILKRKTAPVTSPFFTPTNSPKKLLKTSKSNTELPESSPKSTRRSPRSPSGTVSCIPFPPLSAPAFGLIQERLAHHPFRLLIAVTFLIKTRGKDAIPVFFELMAKYPTPEALATADREDVVQIIHHLGLQNQRATTYQTYAQIWVEAPPEKGKRFAVPGYPTRESGRRIKKTEVLDDEDERDAWEIGHMTQGAYALDSWRIFCRDVLRGVAKGWNGEGAAKEFQPEWMRVLPEDKELRAYLRWMWLKEGFEWDPFTGEKEVASPELMRAAMKGNIAWDDQGGMRITINLEEPESFT